MLDHLINILITMLFLPPVLLFIFYWMIGLNLAFAGFREEDSFKIRSGIITFLITSALLTASWFFWIYLVNRHWF